MGWTDSSLKRFPALWGAWWVLIVAHQHLQRTGLRWMDLEAWRRFEGQGRNRFPKIFPSLWGEKEFSGSQLSRKTLSFDLIYIWSRTMLLSEACRAGLWAGVGQLPSVFTWQHMHVPTAVDLLFNHPRGLRCHFLDTVSRQTRKDWPCLSLFRCCGALNHSIMFKFNSSGTDGAHGAGVTMSAHTPSLATGFSEWAMRPKTMPPRS